MKIIIGSGFSDSTTDWQTLFHFFYCQHQDFGLEGNPTETILSPRDETTLFQLVLSEASKIKISVNADAVDKCWLDVCEARLFLSSSPSDTIRSLAEMTTALLKTFNVVDRVGIARRLLDEFDTNHALKQIIYDAEYVVVSDVLPWFEYTALKQLVLFGVPNIAFPRSSASRSNFFHFRQCHSCSSLSYKKYPVKDVFLGYLGLAVNIKDSIRLLRCLNRPKRGLDSASFAALRHVAEKDNISAGQAAISFVGRRQLGASFYAPTASHPLYPWSSGLEHLVECLNKCQDALAGDSDDLVLTVVAQDDQMGLNDARKAVDSCLLAVGRFLRKPHRNALNSHEESADDPHFSEANIKQALGSLRSRLTQLTSCDCATSICGETPGRPLTSGGSLLGRAARKLARLLLVVEADASVVPIPSVSHEQPTTPSALLPKTPSRVPPVVTPLTVGHDEQVVRMFDSPCAPVNHTPTNRCLEEENMAPFAISADLDEAISMPERPVFSRYQTNLDWADCNCSPPPIKRVGTRKAGPNIDEIYACSMPSWTTEGNLCRAEAESDLYSPVISTSTTPTKQKKSPIKTSKSLFHDTAAKPSSKSLTSGGVKKRKSEPTKKGPGSKMSRSQKGPDLSMKCGQPSIKDFFVM